MVPPWRLGIPVSSRQCVATVSSPPSGVVSGPRRHRSVARVYSLRNDSLGRDSVEGLHVQRRACSMPVSHRAIPVRSLLVAVIAARSLAGAPAMAQTGGAARDPHAAQPERPTVSTPASTVAPGWIEVEGGFEFDSYADHSHGDIGPLAIKVGLARTWQLAVQESIVRAPGAQVTGVGDVAAALKWRLAEHVPLLGDLAVLSTLKLPTGSVAQGDGTGTTDASFTLISSHTFGPVAVDVNYGRTRRSGDGITAPRRASMWAAAAAGPVRGRLGWTSELFGFPPTTGPSGSARIVGVIEGATYQMRDWLILDGGVALPLTGPQPHALFAGVVYNVGRLRR